MYHIASSSYLPSARGSTLSSPRSPSGYSLPLSVFPLPYSLFPPCSLSQLLGFQRCHVLAAFTITPLDLSMKVLLTVDPIPLVASSSKIAVVSPVISHPSDYTPAYPVVLLIPRFQPLALPRPHRSVADVPVPDRPLLAAGWEELALCDYWLSREHTYVLWPASQLAANREAMHIFSSLLATKTGVLAGNYWCSARYPDRADGTHVQAFLQDLLGSSKGRIQMEGRDHKNRISELTRSVGRLH